MIPKGALTGSRDYHEVMRQIVQHGYIWHMGFVPPQLDTSQIERKDEIFQSYWDNRVEKYVIPACWECCKDISGTINRLNKYLYVVLCRPSLNAEYFSRFDICPICGKPEPKDDIPF